MLKEYQNVRQDPASGHRRLFIDEKYELYVWYTDNSCTTNTGFQLVYFDGDDQKAYTWFKGVGSKMATVDGGTATGSIGRHFSLLTDFPISHFCFQKWRLNSKRWNQGLAIW